MPAWRMNMKKTRTAQDKAHLILAMGVLAFELLHHRVQIGRLGRHLHHIGGDIPASLAQPVDLWLVGGQNLIGGGRRAHPLIERPTLVPYAEGLQISANLGVVFDHAVLFGNQNTSHVKIPPFHICLLATLIELATLVFAAQHLEQKFKDLNMPARLGK